MSMEYPWVGIDHLHNLGLPVIEVMFTVQDSEHYDTKDSPSKLGFKHPWWIWSGVDIVYNVYDQLNGSHLEILGSRGKTVWYLPATTNETASALQIKPGQALKVVKYTVRETLAHEYERLEYELEIQNRVTELDYAFPAYKVVGVLNRLENEVEWFDHKIYYPPESIFLATIVGHVPAEPFPTNLVTLGYEDILQGPLIDELEEQCRKAGILTYDLCLGNALYSGGRIRVVDFHKWRLTSTHS